MKIALLYEHPTWSVPLMSRLHERNIEFTAIDVGAPLPGRLNGLDDFDLWVNRVNAMPSAGRPTSVAAAATHLLLSLEQQGHRIVNGFRTHAIGGSKLAQIAVFRRLGLRSPNSIAIHNPADAFDAAVSLGLPVLTKPNIGGSGSGIVRHDSLDALAISIADGTVELGIDGTGLVQELIGSADSFVYRIEIVRGELLYSTRQSIRPGTYNYCAADGCAVPGSDDPIEVVDADPKHVASAAAIVAAASADVGAVEFLLDEGTGEPCFFDFNAYSNFIVGYDDRLGFNPIDRYIDFLEDAAESG